MDFEIFDLDNFEYYLEKTNIQDEKKETLIINDISINSAANYIKKLSSMSKEEILKRYNNKSLLNNKYQNEGKSKYLKENSEKSKVINGLTIDNNNYYEFINFKL